MGLPVKKLIGCLVVAFALVTATSGLVGCGGTTTTTTDTKKADTAKTDTAKTDAAKKTDAK